MPEIDTDSAEIAKQIREYIIDTFLLGDDSGFDDEASLLDTGVLDSTGVVELVDYLEDEFALSIAPKELTVDNLGSVSRLARFVERQARAE